MPRVLVVAGEASGDQHAGRLLAEMNKICPELRCFAVGGPALERAGATLVVPMERLSVIGLFEVASRLPVIYGAYRTILSAVREQGIRTAILVDFPDFNLILARALKKRGVRIFYYVSPQIWAWRKGRVRTIRRLVDHMFVIFPFEADFYRSHGVPVTYAGHPLMDVDFPGQADKDVLKKEMAGDGDFPVIVLAPGSRQGEVGRLYPRMLLAYSLLRKKIPALRALVPEAPSVPERLYREAEVEAGFSGEGALGPIRVRGRFREVMGASDCALVASGTATLETGLVGTPMVVVYALNRGTYRIARRLVKVPAIGMVNLVSGRTVVPELIQDEASPERMAEEAGRILTEPDRNAEIRKDLASLREILGAPGASERIAREIVFLSDWDCQSSFGAPESRH